MLMPSCPLHLSLRNVVSSNKLFLLKFGTHFFPRASFTPHPFHPWYSYIRIPWNAFLCILSYIPLVHLSVWSTYSSQHFFQLWSGITQVCEVIVYQLDIRASVPGRDTTFLFAILFRLVQELIQTPFLPVEVSWEWSWCGAEVNNGRMEVSCLRIVFTVWVWIIRQVSQCFTSISERHFAHFISANATVHWQIFVSHNL
jgi:hypothetical protein